jgi:anthranilate phosphoribosyltransferase
VMSIQEVLQTVARGEPLSAETAEQFMNALMQGETTPIQTAGLLAALAVRGEAVSEIVGFARAMRRHSVRICPPFDVIDTCGTGGDGGNTFNISTATAFVCAAAGAKVAKHGNRAVSSKSGSADVLAALGANVELSADQALQCLEETNLCFLFAQYYHPAMKYAAEPRKQLGFRTIFNILGPLTNPAGARRQVIGVFREDLVEKVAHALVELGTEHALVVHGDGGIDELSLQGSSQVAEVKSGTVSLYTVHPSDCGLPIAPLSAVEGGDAHANAEIIRNVFSGAIGPQRDVVVLNAGAALYVAGKAESLPDGVRLAEQVIDSGAAMQALADYVRASNRFARAEVAQ